MMCACITRIHLEDNPPHHSYILYIEVNVSWISRSLGLSSIFATFRQVGQLWQTCTGYTGCKQYTITEYRAIQSRWPHALQINVDDALCQRWYIYMFSPSAMHHRLRSRKLRWQWISRLLPQRLQNVKAWLLFIMPCCVLSTYSWH